MPGSSGTGSSWADPRDLQTAIVNAVAGDSVFVAQGIYQAASGSSFPMKEAVKIYGGFAGTETSLQERDLTAGHISTLQGNGARVIWNNNNGLTAAAVLDGFTITNGFSGYGAGMLNVGVSPTISNCNFLNNDGGGLYIASSSSIITNCVFAGNFGTVSTYGGGIVMASSNNATVIGCVFWNNQGYQAGGIAVNDVGPVSPRILNCTFSGNYASAPMNNGTGAIYCDSRATPTIQNCIIWGNNGAMKLASSTITPVITNNIIQGGHLFNLLIDPLFVNAANPIGPDGIWGTADDGLNLQAGSPAFNSGTANTTGMPLPLNDVTGAARIQGGKIDIGAYENNFSCSGANTTLYVDASVATSGDGSSWSSAFKTLDEALLAQEQCMATGEILVSEGTYQPAFSRSFSMRNNVKIYGGFPAGGGSFTDRNTITHESILQGNSASVIHNYALNTTALLDGFTITGGNAASGGGMYNFQAGPSINNCLFTGNVTASNGGAGGAMYNRENSLPVITNCIFSGNTASTTGTGGGGALFNSNSSPRISNCIFENNTAAYGGAVYDYARGTAGIPFYPTSAIITNTVFEGNHASGDGSAIGSYGTTLTLNNCTFVNNIAGGGGTIDNYDCNLVITNTALWNNTAGNNPDIWFESGTFNINYSFTQAIWAGTGNVLGSASPFVNIANPRGTDGIWGTADDGLILLASSPCINAGIADTTGLLLGDTDMAGHPRIAGIAIDLGAYEFDNTSLPVTLTNFTGNLHNGTAYLKWETSLETNFSFFEIEKSTDRRVYHSSGKVPASGSSGAYSFNIPQQEVTAYYRLKLVDNDGTGRHSRILRLTQNGNNKISVYPNPAASYINVQVAEAGTFGIYTTDGKFVKQQQLREGVNIVELNELLPGLYYGVMNGQQVKFIKR